MVLPKNTKPVMVLGRIPAPLLLVVACLCCSILLLLVIPTGVSAQAVGVTLCACSPATYTFQLNFSYTCNDTTVQGAGINNTECFVSPFGFDPENVTGKFILLLVARCSRPCQMTFCAAFRENLSLVDSAFMLQQCIANRYSLYYLGTWFTQTFDPSP
jgi:hypothetical protein